ncbi:Ubiquitin carboxyl-terminal hydrolase isozyme L3 [Trachymyrmex cornetzi]|uniref:Ubiquitin carboxyl-terminal hydrolase n=1 Tax=Trachymyrmex cornetzi TaxID=471704 RepID=A0A151J236_9HYME|nr:Ubiquitin carboxyl-terminal hydrolase isozyme L3 [Trachymyrmex cornetzi]
MAKFLHKLGIPKKWSILFAYGLESELLTIIPRPVLAIILLYPISLKIEKAKDSKNDTAESVYHIKQSISNTCGTIALLHNVANNLDVIQLEDGFFKKFLEETKGLSYIERGERLEKTQDIIDTHMEFAQEGQTEASAEDVEVYHHFVAFVHKDGSLYELDGRKSAPINHGSTTLETFLDDAARVCMEYMEHDPNEVRFTVVALAANE